jgi:hypothetical protein
MELFNRGDLVVLRESAVDTLGRVISVSDDGRHIEVRWHTRPEHEHQLTVEDATALRRAHESEMLGESG